jgi:hypothetical protein
MRSELENAMAKVITSRTERGSFVDDPRGFASAFDLDDAEVDSLVEMRDDLISLTPSFVTKRQRALRWNAMRTLTLLGASGDALVGEFVDTQAAIEDFRTEARRFSDFIVRRTAEMAGTIPNGELIAELARFDQLRSFAFWNATGPLGHEASPARRWKRGDPFDADRLIALTVSACVAHFEWDLRQAGQYTADSVSSLQRDPCELLFFHNGQPNGIRVMRLRADEAAAVRVVSAHPESTTARAACNGMGNRDDPERVLGKLLSEGALIWV